MTINTAAQYGKAKVQKPATVKYGKYTMQERPLVSDRKSPSQSKAWRFSTDRNLTHGE